VIFERTPSYPLVKGDALIVINFEKRKVEVDHEGFRSAIKFDKVKPGKPFYLEKISSVPETSNSNIDVQSVRNSTVIDHCIASTDHKSGLQTTCQSRSMTCSGGNTPQELVEFVSKPFMKRTTINTTLDTLMALPVSINDSTDKNAILSPVIQFEPVIDQVIQKPQPELCITSDDLKTQEIPLLESTKLQTSTLESDTQFKTTSSINIVITKTKAPKFTQATTSKVLKEKEPLQTIVSSELPASIRLPVSVGNKTYYSKEYLMSLKSTNKTWPLNMDGPIQIVSHKYAQLHHTSAKRDVRSDRNGRTNDENRGNKKTSGKQNTEYNRQVRMCYEQGGMNKE